MDGPAGSQQVFEHYLTGIPDEDPESLLETLLTQYSWPLMARVVRGRLGNLYREADAEELTNEAMLQLLGRLRRLREEGLPPEGIQIDAFSAGIAANTVLRFLAVKYPESNRLRKRVRYLFETDPRLRLWNDSTGAAMCGLRGGSETKSASPVEIEQAGARLAGPLSAMPLNVVVGKVLAELSVPIELSKLVALLAGMLGIRERVDVSSDQTADLSSAVADSAPSVHVRLEFRQRLEWLWSEVRVLPPEQRVALLLNLGSTQGAALWSLSDLGIATLRELSQVLEMTRESLAAIWSRLPLEDREIAERLGVARQRVINLRAAARQRLVRREGQRSKPVVPIRLGVRR